MIWVAPLGAYVHWLPVTKLQFELFLCDQPSNRFDQDWYNELLRVHVQGESASEIEIGRVSPSMIRRDNYFKAFLTGIRPSEIAPFISWLDESQDGNFDLPTDEEWRTICDELCRTPEIKIEEAFRDLPQSPRMRTLLTRIDAVARDIVASPASGQPSTTLVTCGDQMLLRNGIMEWVRWRDGMSHPPYGGRGKPMHRHLIGDVRDFSRFPQPANPGPGYEQGRLPGFGFRLLRRAM
jgi:hypothetical protein